MIPMTINKIEEKNKQYSKMASIVKLISTYE